jgi:signal transduction histidine kinase
MPAANDPSQQSARVSPIVESDLSQWESNGLSLEAHEALRESEERYRAFIALSSEGIMRFEVDTPIPVDIPEDEAIELMYERAYLAECNNCMAQMYGLESADDIVGARLFQLLVREDPANVEYLRNFIRSGYRAHSAESHEVDHEGNDKYFSNTITGVVENGHLVRAWGVQRDITDERRLEQQKDEFLSVISHELRTPLTAIKGFAQMALRASTQYNDDRLSRALQIIDERADHLTRLSAEMLDVSRLHSGGLPLRLQRLDLVEIISRATESMEQIASDFSFSLDLAQGPIWVSADPDRMEQVISNLLENAVKYGALGPDANCEIKVGLTVEGKEAITYVRDHGLGIPADQREHVFTRFFRARNVERDGRPFPGLGLGLYIAYSIVTRHDGRMWLDSQEGKGSTFYFALPLLQEQE